VVTELEATREKAKGETIGMTRDLPAVEILIFRENLDRNNVVDKLYGLVEVHPGRHHGQDHHRSMSTVSQR
jgi:hypothetical protein